MPSIETLDPPTLAKAHELHEQRCSREALAMLQSFGPLNKFTGTRSLTLAGRIANNMGAPRLGRLLAYRAWRQDPDNLVTRCYFAASRFERKGPYGVWQLLRRFELKEPEPNPDPDHVNFMHTIRARVYWSFRDFESAEKELEMAETVSPNHPWTLTERACCLEAQDRYEEALTSGRRALEIRPGYRPALQYVGHGLQLVDRDDEALQLLREANREKNNVPILSQYATLLMSLEHWDEASEVLETFETVSPILEKDFRDWLIISRARVAHGRKDWKNAAAFSRQVKDEPLFHAYAERAEKEESPRKRVCLPVEFVRQHHMTCAPATLSALSRYWKQPAQHLEVAEAICYDGTPAHSERHWAETHGWAAREFTVTFAAAKALLDRGIPFTLTTTEATSAHLQACIGYDELRETLILRDPFLYYPGEFIIEPFLKRYAAHGPRGLALVPVAQEGLFDGLELPETALHDLSYQLSRALSVHDRASAQKLLERMQSEAASHRLTLMARRALAAYDANTPALLTALDELLAQYPEDGNLQLARLSCLRELGRREERLASLRKLTEAQFAEPVFCQALADELRADAREHRRARYWVERALHGRLDGYSVNTLADLHWDTLAFEEALVLYRFAACLDEKREYAARTYFQAARCQKQAEAALQMLRQRVAALGEKSGGPACTLFECLEMLDRVEEGFGVIDQALQRRPEDGDLLLFAANAHARHGHIAKTEALLQAVKGQARRGAVMRATAEVARLQGDRARALTLWRELLEIEPLAMDAHENVARLVGELEGRAATLQHLDRARARFPHHYGLHQLSISWLRGESPQAAESVVRHLVAIHPADAWARRELASVLAEAGRLEEALLELQEEMRIEPNNPWGHSLRGQIHAQLNRPSEAKADFQNALRLGVDTPPAIHGLVALGHSSGEHKEALAFIEGELVRQVVFGAGITAFREVSNLHQEPAETLASLRVALRERPDLPPAWSSVVNQLTDMQQFEEALALALQATERFSRLAGAWMDVARVRRANLDGAGEIAALQRATEVAPNWAEPCGRLGQAYERAGDFAAARRAFEQAILRQPFTAAGYGLLALRLWQDGERAAAVERIKQALDLDPDYQWAWEFFLDCAKEMGEQKVGEEFARELTRRLPGQPHPWVMLANALFESGQQEEGLKALQSALKFHPRLVQAHDLRAFILASQQRWEEALAACHAEAFGGAVPLTLRGRAAWIEDARGHHRSAIEQMRALVTENPGYHWGWQQLADWHYRADNFEEAVKAATQMARLEPFNAIPLGYRAELKLRQKDRVGAKADLARAVKLDPSYGFAAQRLFWLQLEDKELDKATETLEVVRKHHSPPQALVCELRLLSVVLRETTEKVIPHAPRIFSALVSKNYPKPAEAAREALEKLCLLSMATSEQLDAAFGAISEAHRNDLIDLVLPEIVWNKNVHPHVGILWARRRWALGKRRCEGKLKKLLKSGEAGRQAMIAFLEMLAENRSELRFRWLVRKHGGWLREHSLGWPAVAFGYNTLGRFRRTAAWCADWKSRRGLEMGDLLHVKIALSNIGKHDEALEVVHAAEAMRPDHTEAIFKLHSAFGFALAGATQEARERLLLVNLEGQADYYLLLKGLLNAVLKVQMAAPADRKKAFEDAREDVRLVFAKYSLPRCDVALKTAYRRAFQRMGQDAGVRWRVWREYLRVSGI